MNFLFINNRGLASRANPGNRPVAAFTLLEVMIASGILFACLFAILAVLSNSLNQARSLKRLPIIPDEAIADVAMTNRLFEGVVSGDFGDMFPGYRWEKESEETGTNGFHDVVITVFRPNGEVDSRLWLQQWEAGSPQGKRSGGMAGGFGRPSP